MSSYVIEAIQDHSSVIDTTGQVVFMAIARCCNHEGIAGAGGRPTAPSIDYIAGIAKVHRNTVLNWIPHLEETGELIVERHGKGRGSWNRYTVNLPIETPHDRKESKEKEKSELAELKEAILMVHEMVQEVAKVQEEMVQATVHNGLPQDRLDTVKKQNNTPPNPPAEQNGGGSGRDFDVEYKQVVAAYENEIAPITKHVAEKIVMALDEFSAALIVEAIHLATENNVRKWRYIEGIFDRWRVEGRSGGPKPVNSVQSMEGKILSDETGTFIIENGKPKRIEDAKP